MLCSVPWLTSGWYGRVGGGELRPADHLANDRGDEVPIHPGSQEAHLGQAIATGQPRQLGAHLLLGERRRHVPGRGTNRGRDVGEQVVDRCDADGVEHPAPIGIGMWRIGHARSALRRSRWRRPRRPSGRRARRDRRARPARSIPRRTASDVESSGASRRASLISTTSPLTGLIEVAHGLDALDHTEGTELAQAGAHVGELHEDDVAELVGGEARDPDGGASIRRRAPTRARWSSARSSG